MNKQKRMPAVPGRMANWPFGSLHREVDRAFDDFARSLRGGEAKEWGFDLSPNVDVVETEKAMEISAELPGVDEKDIDLTVGENAVTLKAEKKSGREEKDEKKNYHLVERSYGMFQRRIPVPFKIDADKVEAKFDKGVLKVTITKPAEVRKQTRKIKVKSS